MSSSEPRPAVVSLAELDYFRVPADRLLAESTTVEEWKSKVRAFLDERRASRGPHNV